MAIVEDSGVEVQGLVELRGTRYRRRALGGLKRVSEEAIDGRDTSCCPEQSYAILYVADGVGP